MSDLNAGATHRNFLRTFFNGVWFSPGLQMPEDRCNAFQALLRAAVINFILFGLFLIFATPVYETNDDLTMQMIASGFYTGHPDAHLVFINIIIGWTLRFLYGAWAGCNWYFVFMVAAHYAALTAIAFVVMFRRGGWLFTLLYVGFFLIVETRVLLYLQFTTTAFVAGTAGLLLLVDGLQPTRPVHWPEVIAGIAFTGFMCLIREPVALLLTLLASPFLLERFGLAGWRRLLGAGLACAAVFLVLHGINRQAYQRDPAWAEFSEYNRMRGEIHVTPLTKFIPKAVSAVGWSENDGWMFSQFYFAEPEVYAGVPRMRLFLDRLKTLARDEPAVSWRFSAGFLFLPKLLWRDAKTLMKLAMLNAIGCLFAAGIFRGRWLVTLLISYGLYVVLCFYLLRAARLPERVSYNIPLLVHAICLYWATGFRNLPAAIIGQSGAGLTPLWRAKALRLAALVLIPVWAALYLSCLSQLAQSLWSADEFGRNLKQISRKIFSPIRTLLPAQQKPLLIALPMSALDQSLFFHPLAEQVPFFMVPYGWITHSPIFNQILEQQRLQPYSRLLVDRPDVFFVTGTKWLEPLRIFYREHYGLNIRFDRVLDTDDMPELKDCELHLYQAHAVGDRVPIGTSP